MRTVNYLRVYDCELNAEKGNKDYGKITKVARRSIFYDGIINLSTIQDNRKY